MVETMRLLKENSMEAEDICFSPVNLAKLIESGRCRHHQRTPWQKKYLNEIFKDRHRSGKIR
ncbi:MAG: hypothetical protein ACLTDV_06945 [Eubacterium sp.]